MTFIQLFNSFSFTSMVEDTHCPNNDVMCANSCCNDSKVKWKYLSDVEAFLYSWFDFAAKSNQLDIKNVQLASICLLFHCPI